MSKKYYFAKDHIYIGNKRYSKGDEVPAAKLDPQSLKIMEKGGQITSERPKDNDESILDELGAGNGQENG